VPWQKKNTGRLRPSAAPRAQTGHSIRATLPASKPPPNRPVWLPGGAESPIIATMYSLQQAVTASPVLAGMAERVRRSQRMLDTVRPHIPPAMWPAIQSGPVDEDSWCLLVRNSAVSTKLKLLTPALLAALRQAGLGVDKLRIKIQTAPR